ncbi:MAG: hypothetical protein ACKO1O_11820 [Erythrobacter sp.]
MKPRRAATFSLSGSAASHRDWPGYALIHFAKDFTKFITTGTFSDRAKANRPAMPQERRSDKAQRPYAFLSASELRFMVAATIG